ncbi:MAG: terpene cyclase/mutase family protein [Verrucomicrobiales bacterium]|nr:terpene cyclase/mutase family protein [Verrucomicrobiales bacterium]
MIRSAQRCCLAAAVLLVASSLIADEKKLPAPLASSIDESIELGIAFLVADQNENGSWGSARQTKGLNIYAPVPGAHNAFRAAVTAMAISALIESGLADDPESPAGQALQRGSAFLMEELPTVRRASADAIYNVWTHAFGIQALVDLYPRASTQEQKAIVELINNQIYRLGRYESVDGGWGYYDFRIGTVKPSSSSISFTTATCLVAFHEAKDIPGVEIPEKLLDRAIKSINRQRKSDHTYLYGEYLKARPMYGINRAGGSLGRTQACNYALRLWGDETITDEVICEWLERLGDRNGWLDIGRKRPQPHEAWFAVAGYFYYYGHYYAALNLELIPDEEREQYGEMLGGILMELQEKDGSWWDFPFYSYHQPYGTAFAVMSLARCR